MYLFSMSLSKGIYLFILDRSFSFFLSLSSWYGYKEYLLAGESARFESVEGRPFTRRFLLL
ncbi:hypothetical protein CSUI_009880 [Cystoisospora suis]|uniref:Uncharacterized protein n=1 Tax=Cystoisospora suis TaxID=483139 RepID=A0A2C6KII9_9APIC|nr:hypothetical protein CSUI_009880 [Cystoisospora suis]